MNRLDSSNRLAFPCNNSAKEADTCHGNSLQRYPDSKDISIAPWHTGGNFYESSPLRTKENLQTHPWNQEGMHATFVASLTKDERKIYHAEKDNPAFWSLHQKIQKQGMQPGDEDGIEFIRFAPYYYSPPGMVQTNDVDMEFQNTNGHDSSKLFASPRGTENSRRESILKNQEEFQTPRNPTSLSGFQDFINNLDPLDKAIYHAVIENEGKFVTYGRLADLLYEHKLATYEFTPEDLVMLLKSEFKKHQLEWPFIVFQNGLLYIDDKEKRKRLAASKVVNIKVKNGTGIDVSNLRKDIEKDPNHPISKAGMILLENAGDQFQLEELAQLAQCPKLTTDQLNEEIERLNEQFKETGLGRWIQNGYYGYGFHLGPRAEAYYGRSIWMDENGVIHEKGLNERRQ